MASILDAAEQMKPDIGSITVAEGGENVEVRVVVRLIDRASVQRLVHVTPYEPAVLDAVGGMMAFDVPYSQVEAVLNRLARSGVAEFLAHLTPIQQSQIAEPEDEG
jgi:hypothetical protein